MAGLHNEKLCGQCDLVSEHNQKLQQELRRLHQRVWRLRHEVYLDKTTGLRNRAYLRTKFGKIIARCEKKQKPLCVLMADIDHFGQYNKVYGYLVGNCVLRKVGTALRENTRKNDLVVRLSGEEFLIVLPDTDREMALEIGARIRSGLKRVKPTKHKVTISVGLTLYRGKGVRPTPKDLVFSADRAMRKAKRSGRDQICSGALHVGQSRKGKRLNILR